MSTSDILKVLDNFEGAMIGDYSIKKNNIFLHLKKEKATIGYRNKKFDYNLHFHFGLYNCTNEEKKVSVFIECKNKEKLEWALPRLWTSSVLDKEYKIVRNIVGKTDFHGKYYFEVHLGSKQKLYFANFPPKRYSILKRTFQDLSAKSNAREVSIGKTVENRLITAYEFGNFKNNPTILIVSGFHPPERDTVAIEAIMERFLNKEWKEKVLSNYSFSLIPILNPDGFANEMQGSNINEINFHWKFFGNPKDECPEAFSIWKYCLKIKPTVFIDFHAFTFQNNNARPYWIPKGYYVGRKVGSFQNYLNIKLKELCGNNCSNNSDILAPDLLATGLRNKFGTITIPKFHLHMKNSIDKSKEMSLSCLEIVLKGLNRYRIKYSSDVLKIPYGEIKTTIYGKARIKMLNFWYFKVISFSSYLNDIIFR